VKNKNENNEKEYLEKKNWNLKFVISQNRNSYVEEVDKRKILRTELELKYTGKKYMG
jgi:hypothetical protein